MGRDEIETLQAVREIGPGLKALSKAVEQTPAALGRELREAAGQLAGYGLVAAVLLLALGYLLGKMHR